MWEQLESFHFLRPQLLLLIVPLCLLLYLMKNRRFKSGAWSKVCDEYLLPYLLIGQGGRNSSASMWALTIIGLALIIAFAGPAWKKLPQPVFRSQAALIIILDLSRSMDVTDIKPSRVARAKHKILDVLKQRREGQTALIVYAAEAFVVSPLTEDSNTVASMVKNLSTDLMPYQGSYPEKALNKAIDLFKQASVLNGHVLLLTDGIESPDINDAVSSLAAAGHRLSILGVGTEQGAPIADYRGGFVKGQDGSIVVAKLNEATLRQAASGGNGIYQALTANDDDINRLLGIMDTSRMDQAIKEQTREFKLKSDQWREEGPWILLLLLPLVALFFRKGYLVFLVAVLIPIPQTSHAFDWSALWKNQDQRAKTALEAGDSEKAAELFTDPNWKAAASYRAKDYQKTVETLQSAKTADALYNKGNALARLGNLQEAIESYERALKMDPDHEDAQYNRDLLKEFMDNNPEQNQQNSDQSQNDNQDGEQKQDQQQDQSNKNQNQQQQSAQDQQSDQRSQQNSNNDDSSDRDAEQDQQQASSEQKQQEQQEQKAQAARDHQSQDEKDNDEKDQQIDQAQMNEQQQESDKMARQTEQWLRRIPDDPGGLLRRKFMYQSEMDARQGKQEAKPW